MRKEKQGVKFIRIRGRIVPIRSGGSHKAATLLKTTKMFVKGVEKTAGFGYRMGKRMPKGLVSVSIAGGLLMNQIRRPSNNNPVDTYNNNGGY